MVSLRSNLLSKTVDAGIGSVLVQSALRNQAYQGSQYYSLESESGSDNCLARKRSKEGDCSSRLAWQECWKPIIGKFKKVRDIIVPLLQPPAPEPPGLRGSVLDVTADQKFSPKAQNTISKKTKSKDRRSDCMEAVLMHLSTCQTDQYPRRRNESNEKRKDASWKAYQLSGLKP